MKSYQILYSTNPSNVQILKYPKLSAARSESAQFLQLRTVPNYEPLNVLLSGKCFSRRPLIMNEVSRHIIGSVVVFIQVVGRWRWVELLNLMSSIWAGWA